MYSSLSHREEERSCCTHIETGGGPTFNGKSVKQSNGNMQDVIF